MSIFVTAFIRCFSASSRAEHGPAGKTEVQVDSGCAPETPTARLASTGSSPLGDREGRPHHCTPAGPTTSPPPGGPIQQVFSPSAVARAQPETPESCTSGAAKGAQVASVSQHGLDPAPTVPEEQQQRSLQQTVQHGGSQSLVELVASQALQAGSSAGGEHGQARSAPQEMGQPLDPRIRVPFNEIRLYSVSLMPGS